MHIIEPLIKGHPLRDPENIRATKIVRIMHKLHEEIYEYGKIILIVALIAILIHWASFMVKVNTANESLDLASNSGTLIKFIEKNLIIILKI